MQSVSTRATSPSSIIEKTAGLLVFTRTPVSGSVKTRLSSDIGADHAAAVYAELLRRTLETARYSSVRDIELWCTPTTQHPVLSGLGKNFSLTLQTQAGADLGERMCFAMEQAMQIYRHVVLIGSDCIDLSAADIDLAVDKLAQGYDVVLGPALDGGYYLVGLSSLYRQLFDGIEWGTGEVLQETRERIAQAELKLYELPARRDLDRLEDLQYIYGTSD